MKHLDEGTIHTWLDGALDATQSAEIDAHVKSCAECAAKVAEARGLIAASSRILLALDDVPGNVIPMKAPAPKRRRSITPWLSGLAAAVVLVTLWRTGDVQQKPVTQIKIPPIAVTPVLPEPSLDRLKEPAPPLASRPAPAAAPQRRAERELAKVGNVESERAAGLAAGAGAAAGAAARSANEEVAVAREMRQATEARKDDTAPVMGCYRVASVSLQDATVGAIAEQPKATAAASSAVRTRAAAPSAAPAPAMQKSAADMAMAFTMIRLDSGNVVRLSGTDSTVGTWSAIGGDSARITIRGQTSVVAPPSRVRCP